MTMGWIPDAYRIGHGAVNSPTEVEEPAGFDGERVTPTGQIPSKAGKFTIPRRGRSVYATRAQAEARGSGFSSSEQEER